MIRSRGAAIRVLVRGQQASCGPVAPVGQLLASVRRLQPGCPYPGQDCVAERESGNRRSGGAGPGRDPLRAGTPACGALRLHRARRTHSTHPFGAIGPGSTDRRPITVPGWADSPSHLVGRAHREGQFIASIKPKLGGVNWRIWMIPKLG